MNLLLNPIRENGLASPYGAVLFACSVFLLAWLFPPNVYTAYLGEPDRMFLDLLTLIYFSLCVAAFLLGLRVNRMANPASWHAALPQAESLSPVLYIGVPFLAASTFCGICILKIGAHVNLLMILAAHQGQSIKSMGRAGEQLSEGIWVWGPIVLTGVLWWMYLRVQQLRLSRGTRVLFMIAWFFGVCLGITASLATLSRPELLSLIAGCGLLFLFYREARGRLRIGRGVLYGLAGFSLLAVVFLTISFLRGASASSLLISSLFGYSIASYNRLASLVNGSMAYFFGGRGIYLFYYLQDASTLDKIFHYQEILHWPSFELLFGSEFSSVAIAGLNSQYIWSGVFGYLFADLGWFAPIYVFLAGIFTGYVWSKFRKGAAMAVVCYPWIAVWILFWNGSNILFNGSFVHLVYLGILLAGWDRLFLSTRSVPAESVQVPVAIHEMPMFHAGQ